MRLSIDEHQGFAVAWQELDRKTVQRELTRLHPGLYLHLDRAAAAWTVRDRDGGDCVVLHWPHGLSLGIVEAVKKQEKKTKADEIRPREMAAHEQDRRRKVAEQTADDLEQRIRVHAPILTRTQVAFSRTLRP